MSAMDAKKSQVMSPTPLHDAARAASRDTVERLLSEGADINAVDNDGRTPLHDAARAASGDIVERLLSEGADVSAVDKDGRTPLHDAARAGSENAVFELIYRGADINAVDNDGRTPLHDATHAGSKFAVFELMYRGADVNAVDNDGRPPLLDATLIYPSAAGVVLEATTLNYPGLASKLNDLGTWLVKRFGRTGSVDDLNLAVGVVSAALDVTPQDHPDLAILLRNLGVWLSTRFKQTGSMDDLSRAVEIIDKAVDATPLDYPNRAELLNYLGMLLTRRYERLGSMDDLNRAVEITNKAVDATPLDNPDRVILLSIIGSLLGKRFERSGSMNDLNRAVEIANKAVDGAPLDHPHRAILLSIFGSLLGQRFEWLGSIDDLNSAVEITDKAVDATPLDHLHRAPLLSLLGTLLSKRFDLTGSMDDLNRAIKAASMVVDATPQGHPGRAACLNTIVSWLSRRFEPTGEAKNFVSKLEETLPAIARLIHKLPQIIQGGLLGIKEKLSEKEVRHAEERLQELRTILERISNTSNITFFVDLNDFCDLLDDRIDSVLTVTGSSQDAFANTAARYVSWHWGRRGVVILNWLSQFLLAARRSGPSTSSLVCIQEEYENARPVCIELQARLSDRSAAILPKCNVKIQVKWIKGRMEDYYVLVVAVASQLAWIVAAFKQPLEGLSFTRAKIEDPFPDGDPSRKGEDRYSNFWIVHYDALDKGLEEDNGTCWHRLFTGLNVAVGFPIPHRPDGMRGVELPFTLMATFADCGYPVAYKRGFVLKGWQNALVPVRSDSDLGLSSPVSALQWHLFRSERHRLYMAEAKKTVPKLLPIRTELSSTEFYTAVEQTERHFLGLYQDSRFRIGTNDSRADMIASTHVGDRLEETRLRQLVEWTRVFNFSFGGGMHGVSAGASTGIRIRTLKERQLILNLERTRRNVINATKSNSTILFNVKTRVAWMLPQICVVMYLVQAWIKNNHPNTRVNYPDFRDMSKDGLERALDQFRTQQAVGHNELEKTFDYFADALNQLQDEEDLKPAKRGHPRRLAGVDFAQLASQSQSYSILTTDINSSGGDWLQMLKSDWKDLQTPNAPYRVVTLFCDSLTPLPILPIVRVCDTWLPPPVEQDYLVIAMHCLKELARLYGTDPVRLSREHLWERGLYRPFEPCNGRSCNRLQKIVKVTRQRDRDISDMVLKASSHAAIVFGRVFGVDPQRQCRPIEPQQEPAPPPQPDQEPPQPLPLPPTPDQQLLALLPLRQRATATAPAGSARELGHQEQSRNLLRINTA